MDNPTQHILTINSGSSSIKFAVFDVSTLTKVFHGKIDRIGMDGTYLECTAIETNTREKVPVVDTEPLILLQKTIGEHIAIDSLVAIGHRVVHGGKKYQTTTPVDASILQDLEGLAPFAPRHLPAQLAIVAQCANIFPTLPQFACFDTSFYKDLPRMAQLLPLPRKYEAEGVRRYGFHGLSYEYLMQHLKEVLHESVEEKKIILAHLGSGASMTAIMNGKPVETSMGFSPNSGLAMGTRSGDLDPGVFEYFTKTHEFSPEDFDHMVNFESGLLGISNMTADMEVLLREASTNPPAEEAVAFFCYQVRKYIGAFTAVMGGLDMLVFSGGIGEQSAEIRRRITTGLEHLGVHLNVITNTANKTLISDPDSRVILYMIPTDEESVIARHTKESL